MISSLFFPRTVLSQLILDFDEYLNTLAALQKIESAGGKMYLVGGAVRDVVLATLLVTNNTSNLAIDTRYTIHDVDIEVHGLSLEQLMTILGSFRPVILTGKSFGVLRWEHSTIDWSIPRADSAGRKPVVELDPTMSIEQALRRRDLTINAMALDIVTGQLIDPFNGYQDLLNRCARTPDTKLFVEDPLRFYRVMQFIARFNLVPDDQLNYVCTTMDISTVSQERIFQEFDKLFLLSREPSRGIRWLHELGRLDHVLPELAALVATPQSVVWHPEGSVFEHSMQALDAAAQGEYETEHDRLVLLSAALCHDLGKALVTRYEKGRFRSIGHAEAGVPLARSFLARITGNKKRISQVSKLVRYHMEPLNFIKQNAGDSAYKRLALHLAPDVSLLMLTQLMAADRRGRNPHAQEPLPAPDNDVINFFIRVQKLGILYYPEPALVTGDMIKDSIVNQKLIGKALEYAYQLQINKNITDREYLIKKALEHVS